MVPQYLPFATFGVGVIGKEHGQEFHELFPLRPLFALWSQRSATDTGWINHWQRGEPIVRKKGLTI